ncbi:MAG: ABC transporter ATP-binding protein [Opitutales bacterium]
MAQAAIEIQHLVKDFPAGLRGLRLRAVDDLSLTVPSGQVYGLIGPNGSGKSTTIKVLLGLLRPSTGSARILGQPAGTVVVRNRIGYLPEAPCFHRFLTGAELVAFFARLSGMACGPGDEPVRRALATVGLADAGDRRVGTYSKGMLQRIGLAQALVHDPDLLILDEPTAGVDPVGSAAITRLIRQLRDAGKTILLCSHLLAQVEEICDAVAILHQGRLVAEGPVDALLAEDQTAPTGWTVNGLNPEDAEALKRFLKERGLPPPQPQTHRKRLDHLFLKRVQDAPMDLGREGAGRS